MLTRYFSLSSPSLQQARSYSIRRALKVILCSVGFLGDSLDVTLCTDEIDDVHIPQFSDDAGSQGEWDPNHATSSRPTAAVPSPFTPSSPITDSLRTANADTQVKALVNDSGICRDRYVSNFKLDAVAKTPAQVPVPPLQVRDAVHSIAIPGTHAKQKKFDFNLGWLLIRHTFI